MNVAYLDNLSNTIMMEPCPSDLGSPMMKSIVTLSHGHSVVGGGSSSPLGWCYSTLSCWHTSKSLHMSPRHPVSEASNRRTLVVPL